MAHLWHLLPKPIAQLQRDNGSYQDSRCWYWIEAGWTGAISEQWSLSHWLTETLHGWTLVHEWMVEVSQLIRWTINGSWLVRWYSPTAKAISCRWQIIVRAWLSSETKFARVQKVKSNALLRREQERGCPGSHQTAYQDISPWVTAIDARQMIFATSAKGQIHKHSLIDLSIIVG